MKTKKTNKKKVLSIVATVTVLAVLIGVALYAFLGREENTRTHFKTVKSNTYVTDLIMPDTDKDPFNNDEFRRFEYGVFERKDYIFDDTFKADFPNITAFLTDKNFCAEEVEVKSLSSEWGLTVVDSYSYTPDYSVRFLDMLYIPYAIDDEYNIIIETPRRLTVEYNVNLAQVSYREVDVKNFRVNPYNLTLTVKAGSPKSDNWEISTVTLLKNKNKELAKSMSENIKILNKSGEDITAQNVSGEETVKQNASLKGTKEFKIRIDINDDMFNGFNKLTLSVTTDKELRCDSAAFTLGVNEE